MSLPPIKSPGGSGSGGGKKQPAPPPDEEDEAYQRAQKEALAQKQYYERQKQMYEIEMLSYPVEPLMNAFTFGWMEDGRLGYAANPAHIEHTPRPIAALRALKSPPPAQVPDPVRNPPPKYVCKSAAAGSRHTLLYFTNCYPNAREDRLREFKLYMAGLNQRGLCEEPGYTTPQEVPWPMGIEESPVEICAGDGTSFVVTRLGNVYSWGHGRFGVLGHGDEVSYPLPRQINALLKQSIVKLSCGGAGFCIALDAEGKLWSWGKNDKGQCCRGIETKCELQPALVMGLQDRDHPLQVACGYDHALCLVTQASRDGTTTKALVFGWGDESRGQLGSGDKQYRSRPQENRWLSKLCVKSDFTIVAVAAGGYHNLALSRQSGQVMSWGAGDYGQLGHGEMWDDAQPRIINDLKGVVMISAGMRHSMAVTRPSSGPSQVLAWGYNGYGELGLGDTNVRTQPTALSSFHRSMIKGLSCGSRHSIVITTPRPVLAKEDPALRPFFSVVEDNVNKLVVKQVKKLMEKAGFDPNLLDAPDAALPNQVGSTDRPLRIDKFEPGLRYCMDSYVDPSDWRRKSYEVCFEAGGSGYHLPSICLACSRHCCSGMFLRPFIRLRTPGNTKCYCKAAGLCKCYWSPIRNKFDQATEEDGFIGPNLVMPLLVRLRDPTPVEVEDEEECLVSLCGHTDNEATTPRIAALDFEKWYRRYYDEYEEDQGDESLRIEDGSAP